MLVKVQQSHLQGNVVAPPSKSHAIRVVAAAMLAKSSSQLLNLGYADDTKVSLQIAQQLGTRISVNDNIYTIIPALKPKKTKLISCGESGLAIRLFTPIFALHSTSVILSAEGSLQKRPIVFFEKILPQLNVNCRTNNGFPPIQITGPLQGGELTLHETLSSQYLTGLLMALPLAKEDSILFVKDLKSKPYIDLTIQVLNDFGIDITHKNYQKFYIKGNQKYQGCSYTIEGDWSGAAFLMVAAAISGSATIQNIDTGSMQGDKSIIEVLKMAGAKVQINHQEIIISKKDLIAFSFDATHCPDLFPPLVALAAFCKGKTKIFGVNRLKHKESDRASVLQKELQKLGIKIHIHDDEMIVEGTTNITNATINPYNDHRIAMSAAVIALRANSTVTISNAQCINKSYPQFFNHLIQLNANVFFEEKTNILNT